MWSPSGATSVAIPPCPATEAGPVAGKRSRWPPSVGVQIRRSPSPALALPTTTKPPRTGVPGRTPGRRRRCRARRPPGRARRTPGRRGRPGPSAARTASQRAGRIERRPAGPGGHAGTGHEPVAASVGRPGRRGAVRPQLARRGLPEAPSGSGSSHQPRSAPVASRRPTRTASPPGASGRGVLERPRLGQGRGVAAVEPHRADDAGRGVDERAAVRRHVVRADRRQLGRDLARVGPVRVHQPDVADAAPGGQERDLVLGARRLAAGRERPGPPGRDLARIARPPDDGRQLHGVGRVLGERLGRREQEDRARGRTGRLGRRRGAAGPANPAGAGTSLTGTATRTSPPIAGVIRIAPSTEAGSIGPSNMIAIGVRTPIPATPSAGTTASIPRPAATVVNVAAERRREVAPVGVRGIAADRDRVRRPERQRRLERDRQARPAPADPERDGGRDRQRGLDRAGVHQPVERELDDGVGRDPAGPGAGDHRHDDRRSDGPELERARLASGAGLPAASAKPGPDDDRELGRRRELPCRREDRRRVAVPGERPADVRARSGSAARPTTGRPAR